jgi:membrane protease subunit HflC
MKAFKPFFVFIIFIAVLVCFFGVFTVDQTQRAIVLRLGKMETGPKGHVEVLQPGLHFKIPFIDTVKYFDTRIQTLDVSSSRIPTEEKKELIVDLFTKWKIQDFSSFFKATGGNVMRAETLLREKTVDGLRAEIGRRKLSDVVNKDRQKVMEKVRYDVSQTARLIGIKVIDARIVSMNLPKQVSESVFGLMRTERNRIATEHRAKGQARAETIQAEADKQVTVILAEAHRQAKELQGLGDAEAAVIYAKVYGQDPEFARFYRSMQAYKEAFKEEKDMIVMQPGGNQFLQYFSTNGKK